MEPKNIYRIETPTTKGWQVRFKRQNESFSKFFSDTKYEDSYKAAQFWRDGIKSRLPEKLDPRDVSAISRSRTGVRGISVIDNRYVQVSYQENGTRRGHMYSMPKWGLRKATWKAAQALGRVRGYSAKETQELFVKTYNNLLKRLPDGFQIEQPSKTP